jgi:hypothetical protein
MTMTDFERDADAYLRKLPHLLKQHGEGPTVLIRNAEVVGVFLTEDEAMSVGYARFGAQQPWIVKQLLRADLAHLPAAPACRG